MKRSFILQDIEPFSINATYYGNGFVKTSAAREWAMNIFYKLGTPENEQKFKELREAFDEKTSALVFEVTTFYPETKFYTKKGLISNKIKDLSNTEKGLIDLFLLPKFAMQEVPLGCQNLQLDDKFVVDLISKKRPTTSDEPRIEVSISVIPKP